MIVREVADILEELCPLGLAEDFDNVGLLLGHPENEVTGILVTLDALEEVVDEAIARNLNLIVTFHPIIFKGLKKITGRNYVERTVIKAIENKINIFSVHTALDNVMQGVNGRICEVLGIRDPEILIPKSGTIKKLVTYVPEAAVEQVREALFEAGGGNIGNYSHCSFTIHGQGSFRPEEGSKPTLGIEGETEITEEVQIHLTFPTRLEKKLIRALFESHPYEEVAYEITTLDNVNQLEGMGMIGTLEKPMNEKDFMALVKERMQTGCIRHSEFLGKPVQRIAVLGGSGGFAIPAAKAHGADVFLSSDLKYHQFFEAENEILLADIGHYESEQYTKNLLAEYLTKKIPNFAIALSESKTNPIKYF
ncbi:dinuclear metal center protein, YbgI/SA1388 family [Muriicola jejuensis]|uniref:GTP cyclohydrolase 1 type 2 homolog n=1 Tax=Muriicola jejuensis TaxID=504488 RepID=A0A6P0UGL4_9FLAO|nr:Nif3-like dinuclear metal center hexameric protein [Muriicola jejuensis]NER09266.1 Nif3-like dinuclear metal center hexameric protein [Muriicola jejuensis]SMP09901.1 dinuclear metal center protein, YbgI/SA1388 family [Muriicola jejuensis]